MIYRMNFVMMLLQNMLHSFSVIISIDLLFRFITDIAGLSRDEVIVVVCTSLVVNGLYRGFFRPNLLDFNQSIRLGSFDFKLLKPISMTFQITVGKYEFYSLCSIILPLCYIYVNLRATNVSFMNYLVYLILVVGGTILFSLFMTIVFSLSLYFVNIQKLDETYYAFMSILEKPKEIYPKGMQVLLYLIPLIPIANTPARYLFHKSTLFDILVLVILVLFFFFLYKLIFRIGLQRYEGSSN